MMLNYNATWINVNEYMPPDSRKVIVRAIYKYETCYYGAYFDYMNRDWCFIDSKHNFGSENVIVTHWMKEPDLLPTPRDFHQMMRPVDTILV